jgi:hypothetical protein
MENGKVYVTLASGAELVFTAADVMQSGTLKMSDVVIIPTPDAARPQIAARCAEAWPGPKAADRRMDCENRERAAIYQLWSRLIETLPHVAVRNRCAAEANGDYVLENACEAKDMPPPLPRRAAPAVSSSDEKIRAKCAADWPDNYVMQKYCIEAQTKARDSIR